MDTFTAPYGTGNPYKEDPTNTALPIYVDSDPYEITDSVLIEEPIKRGGKKGSKKKRKAQRKARRH